MTVSSKTVLIVDDDEGMRETLTAILKGEYRVFAVGTAEAALALLGRERVDLVIARRPPARHERHRTACDRQGAVHRSPR